jgi:two-component system cell cycle sensor histidine kinase/response regulator CckA
MLFPPSILVVDDDAAVCTFMQCVLEGYGYRVWTAHTGSEALNVLAKSGQEFGLLVTDVVMPGMSGPKLAKAVRQLFPDLPILYVSGYYDQEDHVLPAACLPKPFTAGEFLERVQALFARERERVLAH